MSNGQAKPVRVRFAPSPTGHLHVGGARTAIFNWLFARHHEGAFVIRVEDTDVERSTRESERMVLDDLRWLGLDWDEGPEVGGRHAPYRQSERGHVYGRAAEELLGSGAAYRCFCSEDVLERKRREAEEEGRPPHYDLTCFRMETAAADAALASGTPFVVRFHVPREGEEARFEGDVTIDDLIRGQVTWRKESLGDFIVLRSDGMPTYNFSVVVDDHEMEITHVIRAEEHLTNTQRQVLLYRALGWELPAFAHVSLILGSDRSKLSKRHGATSVAAYAEEGFLPEAMVNYLTLLGWSPPDGVEIFSREKAIAAFSLDRVNAAPAVFDRQKFEWLNGQYIQMLDPGELAVLLLPRLQEKGWVREETPAVLSWIAEAADLLRKGVDTLAGFVPALALFFEFEPEAVRGGESREAIDDPSAVALMRLLAEELSEHGAPREVEAYQALAERLKVKSGLKGKKLFMPMRLALTASPHGPELARVVPLLERAAETEGLAPVVPPRARVERVLAVIAQ